MHLHGDKLEQYLQGSESGLTISSSRGGIEIGIGTSENPDVILGGGASGADQTSNHHHMVHPDDDINGHSNRAGDDQVISDPSSVWRPY